MQRLIASVVLLSLGLVLLGGCTTVRVTKPRQQVHRDHNARVYVVHDNDDKRTDSRRPKHDPKHDHVCSHEHPCDACKAKDKPDVSDEHHHGPPDHAPAHGWRRQHEEGYNDHPGRGHGSHGSKHEPPGQAKKSTTPGTEPSPKSNVEPDDEPNGNSSSNGTSNGQSNGKSEGKSNGKGNGKGNGKSEGKSNSKGNGKSEGKSNGKGNGKSEGKSNGKGNGESEGKSNGKGNGKGK